MQVLIFKFHSSLDNVIYLTIIILAGIHAREWIAPATALYLANKVNAKKNSEYRLFK